MSRPALKIATKAPRCEGTPRGFFYLKILGVLVATFSWSPGGNFLPSPFSPIFFFLFPILRSENNLPIAGKYIPIGILISSHYWKIPSHSWKISSHSWKASSHWGGTCKMIDRRAKNPPKSLLFTENTTSSA